MAGLFPLHYSTTDCDAQAMELIGFQTESLGYDITLGTDDPRQPRDGSVSNPTNCSEH